MRSPRYCGVFSNLIRREALLYPVVAVRLKTVLPGLPFFVVIRITPLEPCVP